jgi:hypothetical protein
MIRRAVLSLVLAAPFCAVAAAEVVEEKYDSGKPRRKYETGADGKKDGTSTEWYENGQVKVRAAYKSGKLDGPYASFHPNGQPHVTASYRAGKLDGAYSETTDKGLKKVTAVYREGELNGPVTRYDNSKPALTLTFKDGEPVYAKSVERIRKQLADILSSPDGNVDSDRAEHEAALRRLKAFRYLADVPWQDLTLDDEMTRYAVAAAQICEKIRDLDHTPPNPGLPAEEYKRAYQGALHSNLYASSRKDVVCADSLVSFMDDSDPTNIDRVGHRRWCLNPRMKKVGFGRAGGYVAMMSHDNSRPMPADLDFVCYPARGYTPVEYFRGKCAWSVSLNPQWYRKPDESVKPAIYEVDSLLDKVGEPLKLNFSTVSTERFGLPICIIFRPDNFRPLPGKRYLVEVPGLVRMTDQQAVTLRYVVEFVRLD